MRVHFWHGLAMLLLAMINIILGLFLAMVATGVWAAYFAFMFIAVGTYCVAQTMSIF